VITQTGSEIILYQNRFADDTTPSSRSHSGAPSFLEWFDFSETLPVASFSLRPTTPYPGWIEKTFQAELPGGRFINPFTTLSNENEATGLPSEIPARYPLSMVSYNAGDDAGVLIPGQEGLFAYGGTPEEVVAKDSRLQPVQRQPLLLESLGQVLVLDVGGEAFARVQNYAGGNVFSGGAASAGGTPLAGKATTMTLNSYPLSDLSGEDLWSVEVEVSSETVCLARIARQVLLDGKHQHQPISNYKGTGCGYFTIEVWREKNIIYHASVWELWWR
jgi:hypothetical protein